MLTSPVLSPGVTVHHGLKLWLLVHHVSVYHINCHLKLTSSKDLLHGIISLNQLSILQLTKLSIHHLTIKVLILIIQKKAMKLLSIFAFVIMVIKVFHYSNLAFIKSNLIAKKIIQLYLDCYMMSLNLSSFVTPKIELQS